MKKFRPLHDRVLIKRIASDDKTASGLIIPDAAKEKPFEGQVIAVGSGKVLADGKRHKPDVEPGQRIMFGKYSGTEIKLDGEEHLILREEDILAVLS